MGKTVITVNVTCHAGYRGEETPRRFFIKERQIAVAEIIDRWLAPDHRYFFRLRGMTMPSISFAMTSLPTFGN